MAHKKRQARYISLLIISDEKKEPRSIRIKRRTLSFLVGLLVLLGLLIGLGAVSYWKVASLALENNSLREENLNLRTSLQQLDKIKEDLSLVQNYSKQLRTSLSGYVTIENAPANDSLDLKDLNLEQMSVDKRKTLFSSIPALKPVDGFVARGFITNSLFMDAHFGIDIAAPTGTPVKAAADGVVMFSGWTDDGGYVIIIEHEFGFLSIYKHNQYNMVYQLEKVSKGQVIALLGNTGRITSGPHLHFEIWNNGRPVNPAMYITESITDKS